MLATSVANQLASSTCAFGYPLSFPSSECANCVGVPADDRNRLLRRVYSDWCEPDIDADAQPQNFDLGGSTVQGPSTRPEEEAKSGDAPDMPQEEMAVVPEEEVTEAVESPNDGSEVGAGGRIS